MILLDLEGTVIDDLFSMNWENENIERIKSFISTNFPGETHFSIFTYGWLNETEIDFDFIHLLESKLGLKNQYVFVKGDVFKSIGYVKEEYDFNDEDKFPDLRNKEFGALKTFVNISKVVLIDDVVETKSIYFGRFDENERREIHFINVKDI